MRIVSAVCVSLGIILMASAFLYPRTVKPQSLWSEEQAMERIEAGYAVHALTHAHSHNPAEMSRIERREEETLNRYEKIQAQLLKARQRPWRIASFLKWLGVASTVLGVGVYYATRESGWH